MTREIQSFIFDDFDDYSARFAVSSMVVLVYLLGCYQVAC